MQRKTTPPRSTSVCGVWKIGDDIWKINQRQTVISKEAQGFYMVILPPCLSVDEKKQKINHISTNLQGCLDIRLIVAKRNHDNDYNYDIYIKSEIM